MRIGILGSGLMGSKLGTIFARAGHDVVFSYSTSERKLKRLARESGGRARAGTPREAALDADALLLAVHWSRVADVFKQAGDLTGKVIISCSLPMNASDTALAVAHTSSGAEALAKKVRKAKGFRIQQRPERGSVRRIRRETTDPPPAEPHVLRRRPKRERGRGDVDS
jgi:8-hydroxy-5-deazaflavin:NADPH oxidoreductase